MAEIKLLTSDTAFDLLHKAADTHRTTTKVPTDALNHLLIDHSVMARALRSAAFSIVSPEPPPRKRSKTLTD